MAWNFVERTQPHSGAAHATKLRSVSQHAKPHPPNTQKGKEDKETPTGRKEQLGRALARDFYSKNPTPNGSRPSDLIGLYRKRQPRKKRPQPAKRSSREEGGGDRGSTAARPTLTRDWGGPQVRDPVPIVSVFYSRGKPSTCVCVCVCVCGCVGERESLNQEGNRAP